MIPNSLEIVLEKYGNDFFHNLDDLWDSEKQCDIDPMEGTGWTATGVTDFGGEGQGESFWTVWRFNRGSEVVFVKFDGWYDSNCGSEFEEYFEVVPKEQTITVYEKV